MISALSVEFLPVVYANCCMGWIAWALTASFQPRRFGVVQSPYARLTVALPYFAISASRASMIVGVVLSPSMSTASLMESAAETISGVPLGESRILPRRPTVDHVVRCPRTLGGPGRRGDAYRRGRRQGTAAPWRPRLGVPRCGERGPSPRRGLGRQPATHGSQVVAGARG